MSATLLKLLRDDVDVAEAGLERGRLVVRMSRHAPSDAWSRIDRLIGEFGALRKPLRRRRRAA